MSKTVVFLSGLLAGIIIAFLLVFSFTLPPVRTFIAATLITQAITSPSNKADVTEWKVEEVKDAITRESRWILYRTADPLGWRGAFAFRCEKFNGDQKAYTYMMIKIDRYYASYSENKTEIEYRIGDKVEVALWLSVGDGFFASPASVDALSILHRLPQVDSVAFRAMDREQTARDLEIPTDGIGRKIEEFKRGCASI